MVLVFESNVSGIWAGSCMHGKRNHTWSSWIDKTCWRSHIQRSSFILWQ